MELIDELSIYYAIRLLTNNVRLEPKDEILGIYDINDRLKVKVFKTTPMGSRKDKI